MMQWQRLKLSPSLQPPWLKMRAMHIPTTIRMPPHVHDEQGKPVANFDLHEMIATLRDERYAPAPSWPTRGLPIDYQRLPAWLRFNLARLRFLSRRWTRNLSAPHWPIEPALDVLRHLTHDWPANIWQPKSWGFIITCDVDTPHGLKLCDAVAKRVEQFGYRACFFIVGNVIAHDPAIVQDLHQRGHEIASHDMVHDNRLVWLSRDERRSRLKQARQSIEPYEGVGFRSPSLLRDATMLKDVADHFVYDSSVCDTDLEQTRGCTTVMPFRSEGRLEIPVTLPMDCSLMFMAYSDERARAVWHDKCEYIRGVGGLATLVTHAEPQFSGQGRWLEVMTRFLRWVQEQPDVKVLLPRQVAEVWP